MPVGFKIGRHTIGPGNPVFIIAEAGVNHNGDVRIARKLVDTAAKAGADAVKFQTFTAESVASSSAGKAAYQSKNDPRHKSQLEMLESLELSADEFGMLKDYCGKAGVMFLSTPFDIASADLLERLGVEAFKIPSGEITNVQLIRHIARKKKPIILSTGMSNMGEVRNALEIIYSSGNRDVAVLQCTTSYPAAPETLNLSAMRTMAGELGVPTGFSDHSEGILAPIVAVGAGACIIEKHFTLDRKMEGPDHKASIEPAEIAQMVKSIRTAELMLGNGVKSPASGEKEISKLVRRGLFASKDMAKGEKLSAGSIIAKRPMEGIPAERFDDIVGRKLKKDIPAGNSIKWEDLEAEWTEE